MFANICIGHVVNTCPQALLGATQDAEFQQKNRENRDEKPHNIFENGTIFQSNLPPNITALEDFEQKQALGTEMLEKDNVNNPGSGTGSGSVHIPAVDIDQERLNFLILAKKQQKERRKLKKKKKIKKSKKRKQKKISRTKKKKKRRESSSESSETVGSDSSSYEREREASPERPHKKLKT